MLLSVTIISFSLLMMLIPLVLCGGIKDMHTKEFKKVSSLCGVAMLTAIKMILSFFRLVASSIKEFNISHLAVGVCAMYYGPLLSGIAGVIADTIEFIIRPSGPYFPGFAVNEFLIGIIYGCMFYRKKITWKNVLGATTLVYITVKLCLTTLWVSMITGTDFNILFAARFIPELISFPIDFLLLFFLLKTIQRIRKLS